MNKKSHLGSTASLLSCAVFSALLVGCGSGSDKAPTVQNELGTFKGVSENGHAAFKGIRYAAAPTGNLRFKAPTAAPAFEGTYNADEFGSACPQAGGTFGVSSNNEDCLFLNVYTPEVDGEYPVMVWIHGGAFVTGAGSEYDPTKLVDEGITVVTINYRLGALGFLSHPELTTEAGAGSGNYGLMDQQFALQWIQDNIESFGGNPDNVTIFGESAGGHSVTSQIVAAADYEGTLFHKAIIQSGNYHLEQLNQASAEFAGSQTPGYLVGSEVDIPGYAATLGCNAETENLTCLRSKTVEQILAAQTQSQYIPTAGSYTVGELTISNAFLPTPADEAIANGDIADVVIMNGTNLNEGTLFTALEQLDAFNEALAAINTDGDEATQSEQFQAFLASPTFIDEESEYDENVDNLFELFQGLRNGRTEEQIGDYYLAEFSEETDAATKHFKAASKMHTDWRFACTASKTNLELAEHTTVYSYHFTDTGAPNLLAPFNPLYLGATHASEIQYIFNDGESGFTASQEALSEAMVDYWTSFAKTGTPTNGSVAWPAFDSTDSAAVIDLNPTLTLTTKAAFDEIHNCDYWNTPPVLEAPIEAIAL